MLQPHTATPQSDAQRINADIARQASARRSQRVLAGRLASRMRAQARARGRGSGIPTTYRSLGAFVSDNPRRELRHEHELGDLWLGDGFPAPAWRAAWLPATGELYLQRTGGVRPGGRVTIAARFANESALGERLAGWEDIAGTGGSIHWLLERLGIDDSHLPATAAGGEA